MKWHCMFTPGCGFTAKPNIFLDQQRESVHFVFPSSATNFLHILWSLLSTDFSLSVVTTNNFGRDSVGMSIFLHKADTHTHTHTHTRLYPCCRSNLWNVCVAFRMNPVCMRVWHVFYQHNMFSLAFFVLCSTVPDWEHIRQQNRNREQ